MPEVAIPDNVRHRQATQTIATAPEPNAWLVRTEWSAQMAPLQQGAKHLEQQAPVPMVPDNNSTNAEELQPCFADPVKGSVMSLADCQAKYPHMQLVSQRSCQPGAWARVYKLLSLRGMALHCRCSTYCEDLQARCDLLCCWRKFLVALFSRGM